MSQVNLTERAAQEVKRITEEQKNEDPSGTPEKLYLRLRIVGGGCSGWQTKLDLDDVVNEKTDLIFEQHGVNVVVDKRSILYADGATIDFLDDLNKRGFKVDIAGTKGTCGCGSSFSM